MWLSCHTQEEIAKAEGMTKQAIGQICKDFADLQKIDKSSKAAAEHAVDFEVPRGSGPATLLLDQGVWGPCPVACKMFA